MSAASNTELSSFADTDAAADSDGAADTLQQTSTLVQLVAQLHGEVSRAKDEARQYAESVAMWQERAGALRDQLALAESKIAVLEAPSESTLEAVTGPIAAGSTQEPHDSRARLSVRLWPAGVAIAVMAVMVVISLVVLLGH